MSKSSSTNSLSIHLAFRRANGVISDLVSVNNKACNENRHRAGGNVK